VEVVPEHGVEEARHLEVIEPVAAVLIVMLQHLS
jgi:hypothetical protein